MCRKVPFPGSHEKKPRDISNIKTASFLFQIWKAWIPRLHLTVAKLWFWHWHIGASKETTRSIIGFEYHPDCKTAVVLHLEWTWTMVLGLQCQVTKNDTSFSERKHFKHWTALDREKNMGFPKQGWTGQPFFLSFLVENHWSLMDGHCPQERWVSSITSCSHQPLLRLLATSLPEQTDSNQIFPIRPLLL